MPAINNWHKHVGFSGSRHPLPAVQANMVREVLEHLVLDGMIWLHHGDCVGADATAHALAREFGMKVWLHPQLVDTMRAHCTGDKTEPPRDYLARNKNIAYWTKVLVAAPSQSVMVERSGTWATVRYARKIPHRVYLVLPDGTVNREF